MTVSTFQKTILDWYAINKRSMPWRETHDPYKILVSEIMLQQTQVSRVIPKYQAFITAFPNAADLAKAPEKKLLTLWSGLGYWRRAKFLKAAAGEISTTYKGVFPKDPKELQKLPGVGPYTAGAIACFAFNEPVAFIDTNIRRVFLHFFFPNQKNVNDKDIYTIVEKSIVLTNPRDWYYALFDYGATELKDKSINKKSRHYVKQSQFKGSFRSFRAKTVKHLLAQTNNNIGKADMLDFIEDNLRKEEKDYSPQEIIDSLIKDKLVKQTKDNFYL